MNCEQCNHFMVFGENKGIMDVDVDGMCTRLGSSSLWTPVRETDNCHYYFRGDENPTIPHLEPQQAMKPLGITPNTRQILDNAKKSIETRKEAGICGGCSNWRRKGFSVDGECWKQGTLAAQTSIKNTCDDFYARPNNKGQAGDIVTIQVGKQWKVLFVGQKHVLCVDQQNKERVFDLEGLEFTKC